MNRFPAFHPERIDLDWFGCFTASNVKTRQEKCSVQWSTSDFIYRGSSSAVDFDLRAGHLLPMARENPQGSSGASPTGRTNTTVFCWRAALPTVHGKWRRRSQLAYPVVSLRRWRWTRRSLLNIPLAEWDTHTTITDERERSGNKQEVCSSSKGVSSITERACSPCVKAIFFVSVPPSNIFRGDINDCLIPWMCSSDLYLYHYKYHCSNTFHLRLC